MNKYQHVHIRFDNRGTTYTYRVPLRYKVTKGQFVIVLGHSGKSIVQVHKVLTDYKEKPGINYKNIYGIVKLVEEPKPVGFVAQEADEKANVTSQELLNVVREQAKEEWDRYSKSCDSYRNCKG